jgi:ribosomal protein S11
MFLSFVEVSDFRSLSSTKTSNYIAFVRVLFGLRFVAPHIWYSFVNRLKKRHLPLVLSNLISDSTLPLRKFFERDAGLPFPGIGFVDKRRRYKHSFNFLVRKRAFRRMLRISRKKGKKKRKVFSFYGVARQNLKFRGGRKRFFRRYRKNRTFNKYGTPFSKYGNKSKRIFVIRILFRHTANNLFITVTSSLKDSAKPARIILYRSLGMTGMKNTKKNTPFAAVDTGKSLAYALLRRRFYKAVVVLRSGLNFMVKAAIRGISLTKLRILSIYNETLIAHNGIRRPKLRRI